MTTDSAPRTELRRLAEEASPGPWHWHTYGHANLATAAAEVVKAIGKAPLPSSTDLSYVHSEDGEDGEGPTVGLTGNGPKSDPNARFIAAANPTAILSLLDALDEAEAALPGPVSADVVGLRDALLDVHILRYDRDDPYGYWTCGCGQMLAPDGVDEYRTHLLEALAAAREAGPPGAATLPRHTCRHGIEPCEACAAAEPADEGLRLLRALTDAVDGAPEDDYWTDERGPGNKPWNAARAYLNAPTRRTSDAG